MGRATRWLRGLLGGKKSGVGELPAEHKEKRRWGFGKSFREKERPQLQQQQQKRGEPPPSPAVSEERKGSYRERRLPYERVVMDEENQNKRAIAVAAATAVVAEAAVAAAQAAAVVVRLTSSGHTAAGIAAGKQEAAAIKIQSAFRGYLLDMKHGLAMMNIQIQLFTRFKSVKHNNQSFGSFCATPVGAAWFQSPLSSQSCHLCRL